uniref:Putative ribonuclease H-like domain-containing protein n=1 Tax=Tanacetum cinerariifolium TaxID=118510 RepID=A0A6L2MTV5_TANCI|nr:putative ribonuclease H-like domain-containing protein [Tanacetum cinerariifolium]
MRTKPGVDTLSFDDLYNNLKVFESDVKGSTGSSSSTQNVAFVSSDNTSSTNEVNTSYGVMISMRLKKFYKKTGRKLHFDAKKPVGFDKNKVECFNCYNIRNFARECVDWTGLAKDDIEDYALMAFSNSGSDTEVTSCSKECENTYAKLKNLYDEQREQIVVDSIEIQAYTLALKKVEAYLVYYHKNQLAYEEKISTNEVDTASIEVSAASTPVNTVSFPNNTANLSDATVYAFLANQPNGSQLMHADLEQIHKDDLEEIDLKWQLALLSMRAKRYFQRTCKKITINGSDTAGYDKTKVECFNCHKMGHFLRKCKSPKSQESRPRNQDSSRKTVIVEDTSSKAMVAIDGAGFDWSYMGDDEVPTNMALIAFSDSEGDPQTALRDTRIFDSSSKGGKIIDKGKIRTRKLDFKDVYFVKELKFNLFSVSQMCDKKNSVLFTKTECLILSPNFKLPDENQVLLKVPRKNNIYSFDLKNVVPSKGLTCLFAKTTNDESNLWHRRLGHINFKTMNKLVKENLVRGIENQLNHKVKIIRCDSGTEFKNYEMNQLCGVKGIKMEFSNAKTSQQNGIAERKNRTIIEAARTMLTDSLLPIPFWAEAANIDCYVQNRVLVTKPHNKTPYELLTGRAPIISYIRPFGYSVTILNTLDHLRKFDGKADEGFLVGSGPKWLFDIDSLTNLMNYQPVNAGNRTNVLDTSSDVPSCNEEVESSPKDDASKKSIVDPTCVEGGKIDDLGCLDQQMKSTDDYEKTNSTNSLILLVQLHPAALDDFSKMPNLEETGIFDDAYDDKDKGAEADYNKLEIVIPVSPIPSIRIHKDHPKEQIIREMEPKKVTHALDDEIWVEAMQEELFQFKLLNRSLSTEFEQLMHNRFQMSSMGELTFFLGLQVEQRKDGIFLIREKYVCDILKKFSFSSVKSARFQVQPKVSHMHAVKRIFRYLKGHPTLGLWYLKGSPLELIAYSDSDYAGASLDRKSTTGGCQFLGSRLISWQCKKQTIVANSTTEVEYIAASSCCGQVLWLQNQLLDYGYNFMQTKIHVDNESAICVVKNPVYHSKTKYIKIRHHFIRDSYEKRLIEMVKIHTDSNVADLLTKAFDVRIELKGFFLMMVMLIWCNMLVTELILLVFSILDFINTTNGHQYTMSNRQERIGYSRANRNCSKTVNSVKQIHAIVDGKVVVISESLVRSDLLFDDEDGITCLTNDEIFENLALMSYKPLSTKLTFQKDSDNIIKTQTMAMHNVDIPQEIDTCGRPKRQETIGGTSAQTRSEGVLEQPNKPPLTEGHPSRSGEDRLEENIELTDTIPTPHDLPLTGGYTSGSDEGRITLAELMETCTILSNRVTQLKTEISTTKTIYNKAFITLTNRVKKLESQLKHKKSRAVIHSSDEEGPSVHIEDSPKQGRIIKEMDKDENINLFSKQGEVQETAKHLRDDDETLAETLLNIKRSSAKDKGKGIMQETELSKKLKKKEMIQLTLELQRQLDQRKENIPKGDQAKEIDWNDPQVLRYHALQNRPFSKIEVRKNMIMIWDQVHTFVSNDFKIEREVMKRAGFNLQQGILKKQRLDQQTKEIEEEVGAQGDSDQEVEELKLYMRIILKKDIEIESIPLVVKPPVIIEYKIVKEGKISTYHITRADGNIRRYTSMINLLENINREDLKTLWKLVKYKYGNTRPEEGYERVLWRDLKVMFEPDIESEVWRQLQRHDVTVCVNFNKLDDLVGEGADYAVNKGRSTDKIKVLNAEAEGVSAAGETLSTATLAVSTVSV